MLNKLGYKTIFIGKIGTGSQLIELIDSRPLVLRQFEGSHVHRLRTIGQFGSDIADDA